MVVFAMSLSGGGEESQWAKFLKISSNTYIWMFNPLFRGIDFYDTPETTSL